MTDDDPDAGGDTDPFLWDELGEDDGERDGAGGDRAEAGGDIAEASGDIAEADEGTADAGEDRAAGEEAFIWDEPADEPVEERTEDDPGDAPLGGLAEKIRRRRDESAAPDRPSDGRGGGRDTGPETGQGSGRETDRGGGPEVGQSSGPEASQDGRREAGRTDDTVDVTNRDPDAPLGGLADEIRQRRADRDAESDDDVFARMEYQEIASERLWESLDDDPDSGAAVGESSGPAHESASAADREVRIIPKRTCETCPHFADPPTVACTHEGTEILELVGVDRHKVVDCPMVVDDGRFDGDPG